jgi:hypothetical protein
MQCVTNAVAVLQHGSAVVAVARPSWITQITHRKGYVRSSWQQAREFLQTLGSHF